MSPNKSCTDVRKVASRTGSLLTFFGMACVASSGGSRPKRHLCQCALLASRIAHAKSWQGSTFTLATSQIYGSTVVCQYLHFLVCISELPFLSRCRKGPRPVCTVISLLRSNPTPLHTPSPLSHKKTPPHFSLHRHHHSFIPCYCDTTQSPLKSHLWLHDYDPADAACHHHASA